MDKNPKRLVILMSLAAVVVLLCLCAFLVGTFAGPLRTALQLAGGTQPRRDVPATPPPGLLATPLIELQVTLGDEPPIAPLPPGETITAPASPVTPSATPGVTPATLMPGTPFISPLETPLPGQ